jgi:hypothetical protein
MAAVLPVTATPAPIVRLLQAGLLVVAGLALAWLVVTYTLVEVLADRDPALALRLRASPKAMLNLVEQRMAALPGLPAPTSRAGEDASAPDRVRGLSEQAARAFAPAAGSPPAVPSALLPRPPEKEALAAMVREALRRDPLNARGVRLLAQLAEGHVARDDVATLMRLAARLDNHESTAVLWLLQDALVRHDAAEVVSYADTLLRTRARLADAAVQALAVIAREPKGLTLVTEAVRGDPPWRRVFFAQLPQFAGQAEMPLLLLNALRGSSRPPRPEEIRPYLDVLWQNKLYDFAYYAFLQLLPPEQLARVSTPFNGDFALTPSGVLFDWTIPKSPNVRVARVPKPGTVRETILRVDFGLGRIVFDGVTQALVLAPGVYRFEAQAMAQITAVRGLVWAVTCVGGSEIGRSDMITGNRPTWSPIAFTFTVPDGCPAQQLRLFHDARSASEQLASGWGLYDAVRIRPVITP